MTPVKERLAVHRPRSTGLVGASTTPHVTALQCDACGRVYTGEFGAVKCTACKETLDIVYDLDLVAGQVDRRIVERRPRNLWRLRELLPVRAAEPVVGDESGWTRLRPARRLGAKLGLSELYLKEDFLSRPSLSYKDRVVGVALQHALEQGVRQIACVSTGNVGNSVAAFAARHGMEACIVYPRGVEQAKIEASRAYGGRVVIVDGTYDEVNRVCGEYAAGGGWPFVNITLRPYYVEGAKTVAFEIAEQFNWRLPDHIVLPVAGATLLPRVAKGLRELVAVGLVERDDVRLHAAQSAGCAPVAGAIRARANAITPCRPQTFVRSLAIGAPSDGNRAVRAVLRRGGSAAAVSDTEVREAMRSLASLEGVYAEPAAGVVVAAACRLADEGAFGADETVVLVITGHGSKAVNGPAIDGEDEAVPCTPEDIGAAIEGGHGGR